MKKSITQTPRELELQHTGLAIECGTLRVLLDALHMGPVLMMPLTRTVQKDAMTVQQYVVHVTARPYASSPVYYATFRAVEIGRALTGTLLTYPYPYRHDDRTALHCEATRLQHELEACLSQLLVADPRVSQIIAPARYRLPDPWVWSVHSTDSRIVCVERSWQVWETSHA